MRPQPRPRPSATSEPEPVEEHDLGLSHDLPRMTRRGALGLLGGGALAAALAACSSGGSGTTPSSSQSSSAASAAASSATSSSTSSSATEVSDESIAGTDVETGSDGEIPEETAGPYPGDGSNGPDVLAQSGVVRRDIRSSFGSSTTTASGVPLTFTLTVVDVSGSSDTGRPVKGAAVYAWHADSQGRYSMYDQEIADENYLRGVQVTDRKGQVTFESIFPSCYDGRWPHIHFEVYPTVGDATNATNKLRTSQLALPKSTCELVYATSGYDGSASNLERVSLESDMVFSDGYSLQLAKVTGSVAKGFTASLRVPV